METSLLEQDLAPPELEEFLEGEEYAYHRPQRGDIRKGVILSIGPEEIVVNIGLKREGIVPSSDLERLGEEAERASVGEGMAQPLSAAGVPPVLADGIGQR